MIHFLATSGMWSDIPSVVGRWVPHPLHMPDLYNWVFSIVCWFAFVAGYWVGVKIRD